MPAASAVAGYAQLLPQVGEPLRSSLGRCDDLTIGNGLTNAYIHEIFPDIALDVEEILGMIRICVKISFGAISVHL
jgi:hypothetical protein